MKVCPQCGESYRPFVDFCFVDGEVLTLEEAVVEAPEPEGFDAPPPPKMLQGSQQNAGYTRSATPVPRVRRSGRSLVNRPESGGGVYTPPEEVETEVEEEVAAFVAAEDDAPLEAPPLVDDVEEIAAFDDGFGSDDVPEPQPEPILPTDNRSATPEAAPDRRPVAPIPSIPPEPVEEEAGAMGLVLIGMGTLLLVGVVGAIGAMVAGAIFSGSNDDDTETVALPDPVVDPDPEPVRPNPEPDEPVQVGKVDPEPVADPDPVQPDPVPEPVVPDPAVPDPVAPAPVEPSVIPDPAPVRPDPNDGVSVVQPQPTAKIGEVVFNSQPTGAYIFVDGGEAIGTTRFQKTFPYGQHDLRIELEGYEPVETKFNLSVPQLTLSTFTLQSLTPVPEPVAPGPRPTGTPRPVMFFHTDSGIEIRVNGTTEGCAMPNGACLTPAKYELAPGEYTVGFTTKAGAKKSCRIVIDTGEGTAFKKLHQLCP